MSKFTNEEIISLADKLLIGVDEKEASLIADYLSSVTSEIEKISSIKEITNLEPKTHPFDLYEATLREDDDYEEGHNIDDLLSNAHATQGREIEVPKVVG